MNVSKTSTSWQESSMIYFTCSGCHKLSIFETHCRFCGSSFCSQCTSILEHRLIKYMPSLCNNIPSGKEHILKTCDDCRKSTIQRKCINLWTKVFIVLFKAFNGPPNEWFKMIMFKSNLPYTAKLTLRLLQEANTRCVNQNRNHCFQKLLASSRAQR